MKKAGVKVLKSFKPLLTVTEEIAWCGAEEEEVPAAFSPTVERWPVPVPDP